MVDSTEARTGEAARLAAAVGEPPAPGSARAGPPARRPTWAEIDLAAIRDNVAALRAASACGRVMAVVKADGYGHGLVAAAKAALAGGAEWLAVALVEEGEALRAAGVQAPVLVLAEPPPAAAGALLDAELTPTLYSPEMAAALEEAAAARGLPPVGVHLKLDTGMRRVGVPPGDWEEALRRLRDAPGLRCAGLWSHFAVADEPDHPFIARQSAAFARALELAAGLGLRPELTHLCNTAGTLHLPEAHHDLVRPGLGIYGLEPAPGLAGAVPLRPALAWYSQIALLKDLPAGDAVSYGLAWRAPQPTTVATVPAGYADGVTRALTNRGSVLVRGERLPIVGTVTMDQLMVDAGELGVAVGDEVCLIGEQRGARITADDWAELLGTINYEVVCGVGPRVPRVYLAEDLLAGGAG